jgi:hypothetical protein
MGLAEGIQWKKGVVGQLLAEVHKHLAADTNPLDPNSDPARIAEDVDLINRYLHELQVLKEGDDHQATGEQKQAARGLVKRNLDRLIASTARELLDWQHYVGLKQAISDGDKETEKNIKAHQEELKKLLAGL